MKLRKILLMLASILFLVTNITNMVINDNYSFYSIGSLVIIYIPFIILICFTDNTLGKVIAIGLCVIDLIGIIIFIAYLVKGAFDFTKAHIIVQVVADYIIATAMRVLIIISLIRFLKEKDNKWLNVSIVALYVLYIVANIIIILMTKEYGNSELLPILNVCTLYLLIIVYLIKISLDKGEHLLENDNSL